MPTTDRGVEASEPLTLETDWSNCLSNGPEAPKIGGEALVDSCISALFSWASGRSWGEAGDELSELILIANVSYDFLAKYYLG